MPWGFRLDDAWFLTRTHGGAELTRYNATLKLVSEFDMPFSSSPMVVDSTAHTIH